MKKLFKKITISAAVCVALLGYITAQQASFVTLDNVKIEGSDIVMTLSGETKFHAFKISNPPRLIVEFTNTEHNWKQREIELNGKVIKRVRSGQFQNEPSKIARVVVDLVKLPEYSLNGKGNIVTLRIGAEPAAGSADDAKAVPAETAAAPAAEPAPVEVVAQPLEAEKIDKPIVPAPKKEEAPKAVEKPEVPKPVAAKAEKKPVAAPKAVKKQDSLKPVTKVSLPRKIMTFDFEDADIKDVFRILSIKSGINIIYGADVSGTITIHLENVPFDKAFETILTLKGLVSQVQGPNILRITTPQKIAEDRAAAVTFTKVFPLNYAKAEEVKSNLDSIRSAEGRKGNISIDARTNSLIVTDTPEGLIGVEQIIFELDKKPPQVIIEAKLVEVLLTDSFDMGIQWQMAANVINDANTSLDIGASKAATSDSAAGPSATVGGTVVGPLPTTDGGAGVFFPASPVAGQIGAISFGLLMDNNRLTGILTALSQKGLSKILSSPKVTTINNQLAKILIGEKVPFSETSVAAGGVSTSNTKWQEVGIKLEVTPTINSDQRITLKIKPEVSLVTAITAAGPIVASRQADTTVMVKNNETIVIGGLIREEDRKLGTQVPLLGDLPIIGHLFRRDVSTKERTELLVFITPQIIE